MFKVSSWLFFSFIFKLKSTVLSDHGILLIITNTTEESICLTYFPNVQPLPNTREEAPTQPLLDLTPWETCDNKSSILSEVHGKVAVVQKPNCTFIQKAKAVQDNGGTGVLVVVAAGPIVPPSKSEIEQSNVNITLGVISESSLQRIKALGTNVSVLQYAPLEGSRMDYSLLIIWVMAVLSVILGASWSRTVRPYLSRSRFKNKGVSRISEELSDEVPCNYRDEATLNVSPLLIVLFVLCMCCMLLLLYFFYDYLVYVIIAMFCLASTLGLYQCLEPILIAVPIGTCRVPNCSAKCRHRPEIRQILLVAACISVAAAWFVLRKESYSWILQDILGIAFSINMLNVIRLPSFKICTILLVLLFFYDIFFVFVTPLFTQSGESVMVEVATGGSSHEQMPMVLKVPHLSLDPLAFCFPQYSLLGFGDILVPGLLVSYCYGFDLETGSRNLYFISVVIAYGSGLIITFAGLYLMSQAQPALLYLVPSMLLPVTVISLCRKEFNHFWRGELEILMELLDNDDAQVTTPNTNNPNLIRDASSTSDNASEIGEDKALVK